MTKKEWQTRIELAALYRAAYFEEWHDSIFTHISARVPDEDNCYLINSYGLSFDEVTASNLVKVTVEGEKISEGRINPVALTLHNALHRSRPDINCIIHSHTASGVAVSCDPRGLLPISQQSLTVINSISYHNYEGVFFWKDEEERLVADLGDKDILILRNHGLVATASSIPTCFSRMYMLENACKVQTLSVQKPLTINLDTINRSLDESMLGSNSRSTVLMWKSILRKIEKTCPDYKN